MKNIIYQVMKVIVRTTTYYYFSKVEVVGIENIPKDKPCIFSPNHQNAFLDALVIGCLAPIKISYLTRADVFNKTFAWIMDAFQMIPIYRIRDGIQSLSLNEQIFEKCREKIKDNKSILMFSEGNHGNDYYLRPLSKGSSRFALETQELLPEKDLLMIPVGLNYFHHQKPGFKVSLVFGKPIPVKDYLKAYNEHKAKGINALKETLNAGMKDSLLYPEKDEQYDVNRNKINRKTERYSFEELKSKLADGSPLPVKEAHKPALIVFANIISVVNIGPLLLIRKVLTPIKDIVFKASLKYAIGMFTFPVWWVLLYLLGAYIMNPAVGFGLLMIGVFSLSLRKLLIRWSNPPH